MEQLAALASAPADSGIAPPPASQAAARPAAGATSFSPTAADGGGDRGGGVAAAAALVPASGGGSVPEATQGLGLGSLGVFGAPPLDTQQHYNVFFTQPASQT
jgi:hypothetical protein